MFFWGLGVELVNAYKMYRIYNLNMGISERTLLSHFEFQQATDQLHYKWSEETTASHFYCATQTQS